MTTRLIFVLTLLLCSSAYAVDYKGQINHYLARKFNHLGVCDILPHN